MVMCNLLILQVVWAPGSFELPVIAKSMARSGRYGAIICIGAVVGTSIKRQL